MSLLYDAAAAGFVFCPIRFKKAPVSGVFRTFRIAPGPAASKGAKKSGKDGLLRKLSKNKRLNDVNDYEKVKSLA